MTRVGDLPPRRLSEAAGRRVARGRGGLVLVAAEAGKPAAPPATRPATAPATQPAAVYKDKDGNVYPSVDELAKLTGDPAAGEAVYFRETVGCIRCHQLGGEGGMIGPPLNVIGDKLTKPQMLDAIFTPSAAILMEYENWIVRTKDGDVQTGIKSSDTADHITLKDVAGQYHDIPADEIVSKKMDTQSIMPDGLPAAMTRKDMIDLIEFLSTLKNQ